VLVFVHVILARFVLHDFGHRTPLQ
jgi:hypothetical protein